MLTHDWQFQAGEKILYRHCKTCGRVERMYAVTTGSQIASWAVVFVGEGQCKELERRRTSGLD